MAHFVKWRGPFNDEGAPRISKTIQNVETGKAFLFGIWGGSTLKVGPNDPSIAQCNKRTAVEGGSNNITWYELVGRRAANVMIEARNPGDNAVWDSFQLAVKDAAKKPKIRPTVRGINYDYHVSTGKINHNWNADLILTLRMALIPAAGGNTVSDTTGTSYTSQWWTNKEWGNWVRQFIKVVESHWSAKFWLSTPAALSELEVAKPGGGKKRVNLHCLLNVQLAKAAMAHHRITVVKTSATSSVGYGSHSTNYDDKDLLTDSPAVSGFTKPFNTVVHEIGHTLGLHHACESITPSTPYCTAAHPEVGTIMAMGNEYRATYATPWQNAAAAWFNTDSHGHKFQPSEFKSSLTRLAPVDA
jgi:hypothetical protein